MTKILATLLFASTFSLSAFADHHEGKELTPEKRAHMAEMHETMAKCLRTDKAFKDCKKEMHAKCEAAGHDSCPMHKHGKDHGKHGKKSEKKK